MTPKPCNREMLAGLVHLRGGGVSLVIDARGPRLPRILHWGADLGATDQALLVDLAVASVAPIVSNMPDGGTTLGVLPEHTLGWPGEPGLAGHRDGRAWSASFLVAETHAETRADGTQSVAVAAADSAAALGLSIEIELSTSGVVRLRGTLRNTGATDYTLDSLLLTLPVPSEANQILDLTGRHLRERAPQREPFNIGMHVRDGRRGRTGLDATLLLIAGSAGFGFGHGEVWGLHVAWSGNHRTYAERLPSGHRLIGGGELLLPGEVILRPGAQYAGPWLHASYGHGMDDLSNRLHRDVRDRAGHPHTPRPVVLNTWEAVYFDHSLPSLRSLADAGAEVGVERFVLDDGWFTGRRDDAAGLGDWYVDEAVWPGGLGALVGHVRDLGMQFGLWVEPEMVNPDSDLARAHPEWIMSPADREAPLWRNQQVLDLTHPEAFGYILERLDNLVTEYRVDFLKWDHNRDLIDAGHRPDGEPVVHSHTLAVYELLDRLRARHPALEIESCSSGGGRVDLAILERAERVWGSDCNDALERQSINRWTSLLLPPELIGAHVGPDESHTTGRRHTLDMRAGTALFYHFGIEMDIADATPQDRARLSEWVGLYKRMRGLLHNGRVVRLDHPDPALLVHGVVADDKTEAVFSLVSMATSATAPPGRVRLPGLCPEATYRLAPLPPGDHVRGVNHVAAPWLAQGGVTLTGAALGQVGVQSPDLYPEQLFLLHASLVPRA